MIQNMMETKQFDMMKTKPLAMERYETATEMQIRNWFVDYQNIMREMKIRPENLINFDETGFRVECMKRQKVLVFIEMKELYAVSPENRKSCTVIEMINGTGNFPPPPMIIMQGMKIHPPSHHPPSSSPQNSPLN